MFNSRTLAVGVALSLLLLTGMSGVAVGSIDNAVEQPAPPATVDCLHSADPGVSPTTPGAERPLTAVDAVPQDTLLEQSSVDTSERVFDAILVSSVDESLSQVRLPVDGPERTLPGPSGLVALAGFSRLDDSETLEHPLRSQLYDTIRESPGIYPAALTERLDTPRSTLRYHLRVLEDDDLVTAANVDGKRRYVPAEVSSAEHALAVVDEGSTAAAVVEALGRDGAATVSGLASRLDRSPATVSYHLDRLEDAGVVDRVRDGQAVESRLTAAVTPLVSAVATAGAESAAPPSDD